MRLLLTLLLFPTLLIAQPKPRSVPEDSLLRKAHIRTRFEYYHSYFGKPYKDDTLRLVGIARFDSLGRAISDVQLGISIRDTLRSFRYRYSDDGQVRTCIMRYDKEQKVPQADSSVTLLRGRNILSSTSYLRGRKISSEVFHYTADGFPSDQLYISSSEDSLHEFRQWTYDAQGHLLRNCYVHYDSAGIHKKHDTLCRVYTKDNRRVERWQDGFLRGRQHFYANGNLRNKRSRFSMGSSSSHSRQHYNRNGYLVHAVRKRRLLKIYTSKQRYDRSTGLEQKEITRSLHHRRRYSRHYRTSISRYEYSTDPNAQPK